MVDNNNNCLENECQSVVKLAIKIKIVVKIAKQSHMNKIKTKICNALLFKE